MKVFTDLHHGDLYYSLHRLFVERLGFELYRPIGFEWFDEGYWKIAEPYGNARDTINQYLYINNDGYVPYVNLNGTNYFEDGVYYVWEPGHKYYQRAITLDQFKAMQFDIIIPSIASHEDPFEKLRKQYQPDAKLVVHMGNGGQRTAARNVMYSIPYDPMPHQNAVFMHQELDPTIYQFTEPNPDTKNIWSMVNCLPFRSTYEQYKALMPDCDFKAYGAGSPEGPLNGSKGVGAKMVEANIGWQLKKLGGLGHTAMGWFMSGRPVITKMSENRRSGGEALLLFEPGVTCLDIEAHTPEENVRLIREMLEHNKEWGLRAKQRFDEIINYEEEEKNFRNFLGKLI